MDLSSAADMFDSLTAVGDTERFLTSLTASTPFHFGFASHPDDFNALPFEMPLAHALATSEPPQLPNPPSPNPALEQPSHPKPHFHHKQQLHTPMSALTGASVASPSPTVRSKRRISKKKAAHHNHPHPSRTVAAIAASLATPNMSAASDVTNDRSPPCSSRNSNSTSSLSSPNSHQPLVDLSASPSKHHPRTAHLAPKKPTQKCPAPQNASTPAMPNPAQPPKSHTRRCREKVTRQFEHLLEVLPPPPRGVEVRHKAQILDYTINIFRSLLARRASLQTHIALASNDALGHWANSTLLRAASALKPDSFVASISIACLFEPFMKFYCVKNSWPYAETWILTPDTKHAALHSYFVNSDDPEVSSNLNAFAAASNARYSTASDIVSGVISRARQTKRPEWLVDLADDQGVFDRAALAAQHAVHIALAVPVVTENKCLAVLVFAHVKPRTFSAAEVDQLFGFATILGERYMQYSRGSVLQPQQQRQQQQAIPVLSPGVSVDATSAIGVFDTPPPLMSAPHAWTIPAPILLPQNSEASSRSLFEDTKLLA